MKAYKLEVIVVDHDCVGDGITQAIEDARYPNRCLAPRVLSVSSVDIGQWDDAHPLNHAGWEDAARRLFRG